uniref:UBX domain-containing protein n=1 Tax=Hucho hucho TaxID=62062 RepID=A0A4W5JSH4_9TELE
MCVFVCLFVCLFVQVVLRVQFPDRRVLQGFFRPLETVAALRHFVKSHLQDPQLPFYLFIAPPKTILEDPTATLFQAGLFPAALVYFGSDVKTESYLERHLLDSSVSALQADEAIAGSVYSLTFNNQTKTTTLYLCVCVVCVVCEKERIRQACWWNCPIVLATRLGCVSPGKRLYFPVTALSSSESL